MQQVITESDAFQRQETVEDEHCWHSTHRLLLSDPPQAVEVCCWCGKERRIQIKVEVPSGEHGRFAPDFRGVK